MRADDALYLPDGPSTRYILWYSDLNRYELKVAQILLTFSEDRERLGIRQEESALRREVTEYTKIKSIKSHVFFIIRNLR